MFERHVLFVSVLCMFSRASEDCSAVDKSTGGQWSTAGTVTSDSADVEIHIDIRRSTTACGSERYGVHIRGDFNEHADTLGMTKLAFHPRHGRNIRLVNDRKTAYRIDENINHGVVYTDRPLRRLEMLTVKLDKITSKHPHNLGIGVTTHSPFEEGTPDERIDLVSNMWLYYHIHIHINGSLANHHYGKDLDDDSQFKVGDHVGVIVSKSGNLHFFVNGVDQGPVAEKIPHSVYGVLELRSKTLQVSIVDQS